MKIQHFVKIYFAWDKVVTPEWIAARLAIFQQYTLRSLQAQSCQDFTIWFACDAGMEKIMQPFREACPFAVFTFGPGVPEAPQGNDAAYVYVTRIDSDDMYAPGALELIRDFKPRFGVVEAVVGQRGYLHDVRDGRWGCYWNDSSPFHTLIYPHAAFRSPERHARTVIEHSHIRSHFPSRILPPWQFCFILHGLNIASTWDYNCDPKVKAPADMSVETFLHGAPP